MSDYEIIDLAQGKVVAFRFGYYEPPPPDVNEAYERIAAVLAGVEHDISLLRDWQGSVALYRPMSRTVNPDTTEPMRDAWIARAKELLPTMDYSKSWDNQSQGLAGFSVYCVPRIPSLENKG